MVEPLWHSLLSIREMIVAYAWQLLLELFREGKHIRPDDSLNTISLFTRIFFSFSGYRQSFLSKTSSVNYSFIHVLYSR